MRATDFIEGTLFFHSCLKRRKQNVNIYDTDSLFQMFITEPSQDSILGPILFNIFIYDTFLFIKELAEQILLVITPGFLQRKT